MPFDEASRGRVLPEERRGKGLGKGQVIDGNVVVLSEWIEGNFGKGRY